MTCLILIIVAVPGFGSVLGYVVYGATSTAYAYATATATSTAEVVIKIIQSVRVRSHEKPSIGTYFANV